MRDGSHSQSSYYKRSKSLLPPPLMLRRALHCHAVQHAYSTVKLAQGLREPWESTRALDIHHPYPVCLGPRVKVREGPRGQSKIIAGAGNFVAILCFSQTLCSVFCCFLFFFNGSFKRDSSNGWTDRDRDQDRDRARGGGGGGGGRNEMDRAW